MTGELCFTFSDQVSTAELLKNIKYPKQAKVERIDNEHWIMLTFKSLAPGDEVIVPRDNQLQIKTFIEIDQGGMMWTNEEWVDNHND